MAVDYRSFGKGQAASDPGTKVFNRYWWKEKSEIGLAQAVQNVVQTIMQYDGRRQTQYQISARLYGNTDLMGVNGLTYSRVSGNQQNSMRDRISYNVVQSAVDTITAKIAKSRPKPLFLTSGGDYKMQRRAKKLTKFIDGVFYDNDMSRLGPSAFRRSAVNGDGFVHVYGKDGKVCFEEVFNHEILVDWLDGLHGRPRQMHRLKNVDRAVAIDAFPEHRTALLSADEVSTDLTAAYQNVSDQILLVESWHLPSGKDANDGLHVITCDETVLFKEKWDKPRFPFARMRWCPRLTGYFSQGLAEQIQNIQLEVNKLLWVIQRSMHLAGTFKIFVENSSKIVKEHLSNDIGAIISYTGQQPTYLAPPIVPPEIYNHLLTLKNAAYEQAGISQLSAASQKPAGLNSGKALREYNDIESERFMTIGHLYEDFHMDLADLSVMVAKDLYEDDKKLMVKVPGKRFIESIAWKDVNLEDDSYILKAFPVSSLPTDPEGRLATVQEYMQAGLYGPRVAKRLLDFPDLEAVDDRQDAEEEYLEKILDKVVEEAEYTAPGPDDNLDLAQELVLEYIAQGKRDGLEEEKMELLRTFNDQLKVLKLKMDPALVQPGEPGALPAPMAAPAPPPVSDMIQNVGVA